MCVCLMVASRNLSRAVFNARSNFERHFSASINYVRKGGAPLPLPSFFLSPGTSATMRISSPIVLGFRDGQLPTMAYPLALSPSFVAGRQ